MTHLLFFHVLLLVGHFFEYSVVLPPKNAQTFIGRHFFFIPLISHCLKSQLSKKYGERTLLGAAKSQEVTFPRVSRRGRHFANVGDVIIYPDLVVARTGRWSYKVRATVCIQLFRERLSGKSAKVHATIPWGNLGYDQWILITRVFKYIELVMPRPYSNDLRWCAIWMVELLGYSVDEVAAVSYTHLTLPTKRIV